MFPLLQLLPDPPYIPITQLHVISLSNKTKTKMKIKTNKVGQCPNKAKQNRNPTKK